MKNKIVFSEEEQELIKKSYVNGLSQYKIANMLNVSQSVISCFIRNNHILKSSTTNSDIIRFKLNNYESLTNNICNDYITKNLSIQEIADLYNLHYQTISKIISESNIDKNRYKKRKYEIDEYYFNNINSSNKAYFVGLLLADGNISYNRPSISIDLQARDKHILESFCSEIGLPISSLCFCDRSKERTIHPNTQDVYYMRFSSIQMVEDLAKYGVVPQKSLTLDYPDNIDHRYLSDLIRGYFDGDGCFTFGEKYYGTSFIGTLQFMNFVKDVLQKEIGIKTYLTRHANQKNTYILSFHSLRNTKMFFKWLYHDAELYLFRKHDKYIEFLTNKNLLAA